nr:SseB family protein [Methanobrevibacter smithii]
MEIKENNLKELIEKYMSIEETEENHEELHQLGHEIDHVIFDNNFYLVTHNDSEEKEIVSLIVGEDDEYFIPLYTDDEEVKEAIEIFKKEDSKASFETEIVSSTDILETYLDDDTFLGIAINPPKYDFVIFSQNVIEDHQDCC